MRNRRAFAAWIDGRTQQADAGTAAPALLNHAIIIGHGRVGSAITAMLGEARQPYMVIERDRTRYDQLQQRGITSLFGDVTDKGVLEAAGIASARVLLVATAESFQTRNAVRIARKVNPQIVIIVRTHTESDRIELGEEGADHVMMGEQELARAMFRQALQVSSH